MRPLHLVSTLAVLLSTIAPAQTKPVQIPRTVRPSTTASTKKIAENYGKLPLTFEANQGQTDSHVKFLSRTSAYTLFLTGDEAVLKMRDKKQPTPAKGTADLPNIFAGKIQTQKASAAPALSTNEHPAVLRMKLRHANPEATVTGADALPGTSNYFIGNDPAKWRTSVPTYAKVKYAQIYSGIDLVYYGNQRQLEYDFIVSPGSDPHRIAFDVTGAKRIHQDAHGDLVFQMNNKAEAEEIRWHKPVVYQEKDGARQLVAANYAIRSKNRVGFELGKYDASRALYIDPLIYSTYLGGSGTDQGNGIAVDAMGDAYVTGFASSTNFPTKDPAQGANQGGYPYGYDAFVSKINSTGSALVYSTYLGGTGQDVANGIAVDSAGNAYVTGQTQSTDFPTANPLQTTGNYFLSKINQTGSAMTYSTYLDGGGSSVALDGADNAFVTGGSYLAGKVNPSGTALLYSFPSSSGNVGSGIAVDQSGNAYVTGTNFTGVLPTAFASGINATGSSMIYSIPIGGGDNGNQANGIAADPAGDVYIVGTATFGHAPPSCTPRNCWSVPFIYKLSSAGSVEDLFYLQVNASFARGQAIALDSAGNSYVTGGTGNFCCQRSYAAKVSSSLLTMPYFTYLSTPSSNGGQGIALDGSGNSFITGYTSGGLTTLKPFQPIYGGGQLDAFISKVDMRSTTTSAISSSLNPSVLGQSVLLTGTISSIAGLPPDGELLTFMKGTTVLGNGAISNGSASLHTSTLKVGSDSINAVYSGDSNFLGSKSSSLKQVVTKATTTTTLSSSQNPSDSGQSVTFTATVTPQFSGTPAGTVSFYDGATLLKSVVLSAATAKYTTTKLTSGSHTITATYNGSTSFTGSTTSLTQTVN